jgi:hypothetical protein
VAVNYLHAAALVSGSELIAGYILICARAAVLIFVRHGEGTRKQRPSATSKKEAAQHAAAHPNEDPYER